MHQLDPELYTVAWLAPLEIEAQAALLMLDHRHQARFPLSRGDDYVFQAGDICGHNVIIATLPAGQEYGTGSAAALARPAAERSSVSPLGTFNCDRPVDWSEAYRRWYAAKKNNLFLRIGPPTAAPDVQR